jgi:hypothetical protein
LFSHIEKHPAAQKFHEDKEVKNEVGIRLHVQAAEFCYIGIQKLVMWLNKCLDQGGDYVEK